MSSRSESSSELNPATREEYVRSVVKKKLHRRDRPTETHFTLEVSVYWHNALLDSVSIGRRRALKVGGHRDAGRSNLQVEMAPPLKPFTIAKVRQKEAQILLPDTAIYCVKKPDGEVDWQPELSSAKAPFPALSYRLQFGERMVYNVDALTFMLQFVHRDGWARHPLDWLIPQVIEG